MANTTRRWWWIVLVLALVMPACGNDDGTVDAAGTGSSTSTGVSATAETTTTSIAEPASDSLVVVDAAIEEYLFLEPPEVFVWGVLLDNTTDTTAVDVELVVSLMADGKVVRTDTHRVGDIPPGRFAWGSTPMNVLDDSGDRTPLDEVEVEAIPATFEPVGEHDQLLSPSRVAWDGTSELMIEVEPIDDLADLWVGIAYLDENGDLIVGGTAGVDQSLLHPGEASTFEIVMGYADQVQPTEIEIFLTRLDHHPTDFTSDPPTTALSPPTS